MENAFGSTSAWYLLSDECGKYDDDEIWQNNHIFFPRKEDISVFSNMSQASIYSMS